MALAPGDRIGAYEVVALIGAGGMGEVYRARDTKLGRPVAIKILLQSVALQADRIARFEREAKLLAAINHPHIAALYGMEDEGGVQFLVMELVDGETLAERIARGALPPNAALPLALQIADALEAAHDKGIVHRDLKPANIKITPDGRVKVLDFGLARAADANDVNTPIGRTHSPTLSLMATQAGLILGTAPYMSPEQAKGIQTDHRSDVFSFGCVLYEMLTGAQAFQGDSVPDVLASVLAREPDLASLPANLNPRLTELLRRCLAKDPKRRWQAVGDLRAELETIAAAPHAAAQPIAPASWTWRRAALFAIPALIAGAVAGALAMRLTTRPAAARIVRTTIAAPADAGSTPGERGIAITPDGTRLVYVADGGSRLFVRSLDALEAVPIASGRGLRAPFVSPDGEWVGYFDADLRMLKVPITGGPAIPIVERIDGTAPRGASWGPDDAIVFGTSLSATGLQRVTSGGGPVTVLSKADRARGETDHVWPHVLPGGNYVLFTVLSAAGQGSSSIAVLDTRSGTITTQLRGGSDGRYLTSGHLVYVAAGTLRAVPFDVSGLKVRGTAVPVLERLSVAGLGSGAFAVSNDGTLAYIDAPREDEDRSARKLVWIDRAGKQEDIPAPFHAYQNPRISPDGTRIAVADEAQQRDIWIWDIARRVLTRLTMDPNVDTFPTWTHDSKRIVYASGRNTNVNLWWQAADGSDAPMQLLKSTNIQIPSAVTSDGRNLIFHEVMPATSADVFRLPFASPHDPEAIQATNFTERDAVISPDGRWLAYESNSSGGYEVFVRAFAAGSQGQWQISNSGGTRPVWGRDELFYIAADGSLMRVEVPRGTTSWNGGNPTPLIAHLPNVGATDFNRNYDVTPDGRRFVTIMNAREATDTTPPSIILVQGWGRDVASRAAPKP